MRFNKRGFTLVELLVVIVILGVITGISIPLIRNIQAKNEERQYKSYQESLKYSAKLYVDSFREDLFGHSKSGCAIITYDQMVEKGLLKDISIGDVSCDTNRTLVRAVMFDNKVSYAPMIGCGKVVGGTVEMDTFLPKDGIGDLITCGADAGTIISFDSTPRSSNSINYQRKNITVNMTSFTGFYEDYSIQYGFLKSNDKPEDEKEDPTDKIIGGWKNLKISYIGGNEQKKKIAEGESITLSSKTVVTPPSQTDDLYLVLRIESLKDLSGRDWNTDPEQGKYIYLGTYRVDNSKPVFSNDSAVVSSEAGFNSINPKLKIHVTDAKFSTSADLRMCISYDNDTCLKTTKDIKNKNGYVSYNPDKVLNKIQDAYDGSEHTIYVTVGDAAGNYETKNYSYRIANRYTLTYDSNGGNACNPSVKTVTFNGGAVATWGELCTPTRSGSTFIEWNTKSDGTGTKVTSSTTVTGNLKVYAIWFTRATYSYTGSVQTFTAPANATYKFTMWGASGGAGDEAGSAGDKAVSTITLSAGNQVSISVGGAGGSSVMIGQGNLQLAYDGNTLDPAWVNEWEERTHTGWSAVPDDAYVGKVTVNGSPELTHCIIWVSGSTEVCGTTSATITLSDEPSPIYRGHHVYRIYTKSTGWSRSYTKHNPRAPGYNNIHATLTTWWKKRSNNGNGAGGWNGGDSSKWAGGGGGATSISVSDSTFSVRGGNGGTVKDISGSGTGGGNTSVTGSFSAYQATTLNNPGSNNGYVIVEIE